MKKLMLYSLFGSFCAGIDVIAFHFTVAVGLHYQLANAFGYSLGTIISFFLNRNFTFKVTNAIGYRLSVFFGVAAIGYLFSSAFLFVTIQVNGMDTDFAKVSSLPFVLVIQFTLNKFVTFRQVN